MSDTHSIDQARARLLAAGADQKDLDWFDSLGWNDAHTPPIGRDADVVDFRRREAKLNASIAHLTFAERADSPEGKLAAAIGARIADWQDRGDEDA
ncbi:MAG TPA: hypothetical protein PKA55_01975 [Rhodoblastus sp.]|nr:hypothetical protein [Rhodoblastus sp.]